MRILVDTDPGLGLRYADVDDGLAFFFMFNEPTLEVEGITTVFGNTPADKGFGLVEIYLNMLNRTDIPHFRGAASKNEFHRPTDASQFLVNAIKEQPGELTLMILGPMTNIATALHSYPSLLDDAKDIIIMGGTLSPLTLFSPAFKGIDRRFFDKLKVQGLVAEFNFAQDPQSTKEVLEFPTQTPRIEMGLEICCQLVFTKAHLRLLEGHNHKITNFISRYIKHWLKLWRLMGNGGFFPFDTFCPIFLLHPEWFQFKDLFFSVDNQKLGGKLSFNHGSSEKDRTISYAVGFRKAEFKKEFMNTLVEGLKY